MPLSQLLLLDGGLSFAAVTFPSDQLTVIYVRSIL